MRRTLSTAAILLLSGCLGDLLNIGEGPDKKNGGNATGGAGGGAGTSGTSGASGASGSDDGGAGADTGGSSSTGGAATGGGTGGSGADGGGGSDTGGTSGVSGTGGSGPTSDPDVIARAAVVFGSCYGDDRVSRSASELWNSRELPGFFGGFRAQAKCMAEAGQGCGALDTCLGWAIEEKPECTPGRVCNGSRFTTCVEEDGRRLELRLDCATLGAECDVRIVCVDGPAVECDEMTYVENCAADLPQECRSDPEGPDLGVVRAGPDCASLGLECVAETRGTDNPIFAACTGTGAECEWEPEIFSYGIACAGSLLESCVNARRHVFDCSAVGPGFTCQSYDGIPFCGLASECLPGNTYGVAGIGPQQGNPEPACDGTSIVFCNAGRLERIDCTELGFTGCDVEVGLGCIPSPTSIFRQPP